MLLELFDDGPRRSALHGLKIQTAENPELGRDHTDLGAFGLGNHPNGPGDLVFGGKASVEEGDDLLLGAACESQSEEDVFESGAGAAEMRNLSRGDAEFFARLTRRIRERLGVLDEDLNLGAGIRSDLPQEDPSGSPGSERTAREPWD